MDGASEATAGIYIPNPDQLLKYYTAPGHAAAALQTELDSLKESGKIAAKETANAKKFAPRVAQINKSIKDVDKRLSKATEAEKKTLLEQKKTLTAEVSEIEQTKKQVNETDTDIAYHKAEIARYNLYSQAIFSAWSNSDPSGVEGARNMNLELDKTDFTGKAASSYTAVNSATGTLGAMAA